jgi:hypothetical protein
MISETPDLLKRFLTAWESAFQNSTVSPCYLINRDVRFEMLIVEMRFGSCFEFQNFTFSGHIYVVADFLELLVFCEIASLLKVGEFWFLDFRVIWGKNMIGVYICFGLMLQDRSLQIFEKLVWALNQCRALAKQSVVKNLVFANTLLCFRTIMKCLRHMKGLGYWKISSV